MKYTLSNGHERKLDWVTIVLNNNDILNYAKQVAGVSDILDVDLKIDINDVDCYVDLNYLHNTEDIVFKFENAGFSEDGGPNDFEMVIKKTFDVKDFSYFIIGSLIYLLIAPDDFKNNQKTNLYTTTEAISNEEY